nr:carbamate kinase [Salsipaludibacter albus]
MVVIALGGNAISPSGGSGSAAEQTRNLWSSMGQVAGLVAEGVDVVLTHGNGPQVGAILIKNEMARDVVPAVPLDWCVANTQATIGFVAATALEHHLRVRGVDRPVVPLVSRVRVDDDDPAFAEPTKPVGPWFTAEEAEDRAATDGHVYGPQGDRGWRRLVPSPRPRESLDLPAIRLLRDQGAIVIANGGGGIPMARRGDRLEGIEAVIDKDLGAALLAHELDADGLVVLTDVRGVAVDFGTPDEHWLGRVTLSEMRAHADDGQFRAGSMGPKVDAVCRFVAASDAPASIGALDEAAAVVHGEAGTRVVPDDRPDG